MHAISRESYSFTVSSGATKFMLHPFNEDGQPLDGFDLLDRMNDEIHEETQAGYTWPGATPIITSAEGLPLSLFVRTGPDETRAMRADALTESLHRVAAFTQLIDEAGDEEAVREWAEQFADHFEAEHFEEAFQDAFAGRFETPAEWGYAYLDDYAENACNIELPNSIRRHFDAAAWASENEDAPGFTVRNVPGGIIVFRNI